MSRKGKHWTDVAIDRMMDMAENVLIKNSVNPDWIFQGRSQGFYFQQWSMASFTDRFEKARNRYIKHIIRRYR